MFSLKVLKDILQYCDYHNDGSHDDEPCANADECIYKAECDILRQAYGKKPCNLSIKYEYD